LKGENLVLIQNRLKRPLELSTV